MLARRRKIKLKQVNMKSISVIIILTILIKSGKTPKSHKMLIVLSRPSWIHSLTLRQLNIHVNYYLIKKRDEIEGNMKDT